MICRLGPFLPGLLAACRQVLVHLVVAARLVAGLGQRVVLAVFGSCPCWLGRADW